MRYPKASPHFQWMNQRRRNPMTWKLPQWMVGVVAGFMIAGPVRAEGPADSIGRLVKGFDLKDTSGQSISLDKFQDKKAVVLVFVGTQCPLNNAYLPCLAELSKEHAPKGVQFLAINSNYQDSPAKVAEHAKKYEVPFPVLRDENNKLADLLEARRTPEAFILDDKHVIRYRGRIDDQYGINIQRPAPTRRDLAEALNEILAGKNVTVAITPVAGCIIGRAPKANNDGAITFSKHVAPIL